MRTAIIAAILAFAACLGGVAARADSVQPGGEPVLQIEAGMHVSMTNRASISRDGRTVATGSNDKTVRIWNLPDGTLRKILRIPIGAGPVGAVYAVALSPDGRTAAAGGWTKNNDIYLIDVATGAIQRVLGPNPSSAYDLAFSPDGRKLVSTLGAAPTGMRLWNVKTGEMIAEDKTYGDFGHQIAFSYTGDFAVSAYDGFVRIYDGNGQLLTKSEDRGNRRLSGVAFSPDGLELAVSHNDQPRIDIMNTGDGSWTATVDTEGLQHGDVGSVAWSADGTKLFAGGQYGTAENVRPLFVWPDRGRGKRQQLTGGFDTVLNIDTYGDDGVLFVTADPLIGTIDGTEMRLALRTSKSEFRYLGDDGFMASEDGTRVRATTTLDGKQAVLVDLNSLTIEPTADAPPPDLAKPIWAGFDLKFPGGTAAPLMNGKEIPFQPYETALSLALPGGGNPDSFYLGTSWNVRKYGKDGQLLWTVAVPNSVWDVIAAQQGKLLVAALGDGTIRWYRGQDGRELLAFFKNNKDERWIAWTPQGYYAASAGGEDLIGWVVNRSDKEAPDFFAASRFRAKFYRPDIVQAVLATLDEDRAIAEANAKVGRQAEGESIRGNLPAVVDLAMDSDEIRTASSPVEIKFQVRSPSGEAVESIEVLIDGRPLEGRAAVEIPDGDEVQTIIVPVPEANSEIGIFARTKSGAGEVAKVKVFWDGDAAQLFKPKLYAVVVGVSEYESQDLKLKYAAQDASDFAAAIQQQSGGIYGKVDVKLLTNDKATRSDIVEALEWLEGEVTSRDVGMVFMAGHGVTDTKQRFFFLPADADMDKLRSTAVSRDDMLNTLSSLAGKALMFIDACHSANGLEGEQQRGAPTDITAIVNELSSAENGVVMFASSTGRQVSLERDTWQNGAFTEALLEGLSGKADFIKDGKLTINELELWLSDRVKELTDRRQAPVARKPDTIPDFPIAMVR